MTQNCRLKSPGTFKRLLLSRAHRLSICLASVLSAGTAPAAAKIQSLAVWDGADFSDKEGGGYLNVELTGFKDLDKTAPLQVLIVDLLTKHKLVIKGSQANLSNTKQPTVWRIPAGKYAVLAVRLQASKNEKDPALIWKSEAKAARRLVIKRQTISHLGLWKVSPGDKSSLNVDFIAPGIPEGGSVNPKYALHNGFDGALLIAGKDDAAKKAEDAKKEIAKEQEQSEKKDKPTKAEKPKTEETAKAEKTEKAKADDKKSDDKKSDDKKLATLAIKWKFELLKDSDLAPQLEAAISQRETEIRACYAEELTKKKDLKGSLNFLVAISKKSGYLQKIKQGNSDIREHGMAKCLARELAKVKFPATRNAVGRLLFQFDVS